MPTAASPPAGTDEQVDRLYDLLGALFRSDAELQRFLALEKIELPAQRSAYGEKRSRSAGAYETARALVVQGLADERLFAALARHSPERDVDVRAVADLFARASAPPVSRGPAIAGGAGIAVPAEFADFAKQLGAAIASIEDPVDAQPALDPDRWPWTGAASVMGSVDPLVLSPLPGVPASGLSALRALADLVTTGHDGRWVLRDEPRGSALSRLVREGLIEEAVAANAATVDTRRDMVSQLVTGRAPVLPTLDRNGLMDLDAVLGWLVDLVPYLPVSSAQVHAAAERRLLIDPLRSLVGTHFRGREAELARITDHIDGLSPGGLLQVRGAGGAGKTTLLGKILLDLEASLESRPMSFAYLDFDKTSHDPRDTGGLLRQLAQQLRLLYATHEAAGQFAAVEAAYGGTDVDRAAELLDLDLGTEAAPDSGRLLDRLCERLHSVQKEVGDPRTPTLVLVLDTCEEVLAKGPGAVHELNAMLAALLARMPTMRVVVAGRSTLPPFPGSVEAGRLDLGDLDRVAALAVLEHLGVGDATLRGEIVDSYGGNPLTLRLAAEALARSGTAEEAFAGIVPRTTALAEVAREQVQGMLYSRILGHVRDLEIVNIAHPGLAVRRVTVDVIRDVLAVPCGLDPARSGEIFDKLYAELSLFDVEDDGSLRHRQDVRRLMLRTMDDDPDRAAAVADIHARAAAFYRQREGVAARAEELYHRLMLDEDPRSIDLLWEDSLGPLLASALEEPLPPRLHRWLERRLVIHGLDSDTSAWEQEDWEANAHARATSWLASGDARAALAVLAERTERLQPSRLHAIEVDASVRLGRLAEGAAALDRGLRANEGNRDPRVGVELTELGVQLHAAAGEPGLVAESALACAVLTDLTGEAGRGMRALAGAISSLRRLDSDTAGVRAALTRELALRFRNRSRAQLLADPDLVRVVGAAAGPDDTSVLVYAALVMGDRTADEDMIFRDDVFVLTRLLDLTQPSAGEALGALAAQVGMPPTGWSLRDLVPLMVRTGRTGRVIAVGLEHAVDPAVSRRMVVEQLLVPVVEGKERS